MNKFTSIVDKGLPVIILLLAMVPLASAAPYRIQEITKTEVADTTFSINGGNQYLNNKGQIIGTSRKYTKDKVYNYGDRAFLWDTGKMRELGNFGSDANDYAISIPVSINDQGNVAGSSAYFVKGIDRGARAFLWDRGKLPDLTATNTNFVASEGKAINGNGWVLGSGIYYDNGIDKGNRFFLWGNGKIQSLGAFIGYDGSAVAMNNKNQVAGTHQVFDNQGNWLGWRAFLWAANALTDLGTLGTIEPGFGISTAVAINDHNAVIGYSDYFDNQGNWFGTHTFLWIDGKLHDLGTLSVDINGYGYSAPIAINNNNQVIGTSDAYDGQGNWQGSHGFLWADGKMRDLGSLGVDESGLSFSTPYALNAIGQVIGFSSYSENGIAKGNRAFLYQNNKMTDLNSLLPAGSGLLLENALAINDKGQILAYGTRTKGKDTYQVYVLLTT